MNNHWIFRSTWHKLGAGFVFWSLVGLFFSTYAYFYFSYHEPGYTIVDALKGTLPQWYVWGALAPLIVRLDKIAASGKDRIFQRTLIHIPFSIMLAALYVFIESVSDKFVYGEMPALTLGHFAGEIQWNLPNYWLIFAGYVIYEYYNKYRDKELAAIRLEAELAKAHLQSLKAQLHPHFLFNALNTISATMEKNPRSARRMTAQLADILRFLLEMTDRQEITLEEEISFLKNYLEIQQARFEERLQTDIDVPADLGKVMVPVLIIQPLVENAIKHGISPQTEGGKVTVRAFSRDEQLQIQVCDNGVGLPKNWQFSRHKGIGLANTLSRLKQLYNGRYNFTIEENSDADGGTTVRIALPLRRN